jgi:hypothetical protein
MINRIYLVFFASTTSLGISACSVAKLEARLEADPQCKPIINPKSGALMPCPGSDKGFYLSAGLGPTKVESPTNLVSNSGPEHSSKGGGSVTANVSPAINQNAKSSAPAGCLPKIHQKTGGILPCPSE